jgi:hypothetical protein
MKKKCSIDLLDLVGRVTLWLILSHLTARTIDKSNSDGIKSARLSEGERLV